MFNSIHKQILSTLILVSLLNILFLGTITLVYGNNALRESTVTSARFAREAMVQTLEKDITSADKIISSLTLLIDDELDPTRIHDPDYLQFLMDSWDSDVKRLAQNHLLSHTAYIYLNPELTGRVFDIFYADQNGDALVERQSNIPLSYFREGPLPTDAKQWWFEAIDKDTSNWTRPYSWTFDNGEAIEVVSLTKAYHIDGTLFAVVGTEITYENVKRATTEMRLLDNGYAFLLNGEREPLIYPDDGTYSYFKVAFDEVVPAELSEFNYKIKNQKKHAFTQTLGNGWILGVQFTSKDFFTPGRQYILIIAGTMFLALIQSILFAHFMSRYLSKPLLDISSLLQSSSPVSGDLSIPKNIIARQDEIGIVAKSLVIMSEDIKSHIKIINRQSSNLQFLKQFDELTGLPNETHFKKIVANSILASPETQRFIIIINIDGFRLLNGLFGVHVCNQLLTSVAERLESLKKENYQISRLSGDEFILCHQALQPVPLIVSHLQSMLNGVYHIGDETIHISVSIGISTYPAHSEDVSQLIKFATIALNHCKVNKESDWSVYAPSVADLSSEQFQMLRELKEAILKDEFILNIQPQFNVNTGKIVGGEVLLRWFNNNQYVPPNIFIPLSEESKQILPIGEFVLKETIKIQRDLKSKGIHIRLAVNISVQQLTWQQIYHQLKYAMSPFGLRPEDLSLEITESTLLHANQEAREVLHALRQDGFRIEVDDFGTGYSSLSYIKKFAFDTLKLDRMFIKDYPHNDDGAIASMIVTLANKLKVNLIAEGMENEDQVNFLKESGCEIMQGYYFSRPLEVKEFVRLLEEQARDAID